MKIPVQRIDTRLPVPEHAHPGDAGVDLRATEDVVLGPGERVAVPTGIAVAIPDGHAGFVVPRSGLALHHGLTVLNTPGLVDSGYRGELRVVLINHGTEPYQITRGERIAQLVVVAVADQELVEVDALPGTARGSGGFGSTGSQ